MNQKRKDIVLIGVMVGVLALVAYFGSSYTNPRAVMETQLGTANKVVWENLLPEGFSSDALVKEYQEAVRDYEDGDPEVEKIYQEFTYRINNAPLNQAINNTHISLTGFASPIHYDERKIKEFLLVPYYGACIHVPAPPLNQTVYVRLADGKEITQEDTFAPLTVSGKIAIQKASTEIGDAGYSIWGASSEPFTGEDIPR